MKCNKISDLIMEFIDGHLDETIASEVESHVSQCESCRLEFESSQKAINALSTKKLTLEPPHILASVLETAQKKPWFVMNKMALAWSGVAALVLIVSFGVFDSLKTPPGRIDQNIAFMAKSDSKRDLPQNNNASATIKKTNTQKQKAAPTPKTIQQPKQKMQLPPKPKRKNFVKQYFAKSNNKPTSYIMVFVPDTLSEPEVINSNVMKDESKSYKMDAAMPMMAAPAPAALQENSDNSSEGTAVFDSSYSIKMTDHSTGEVINLNVIREVKPDNEIKNTIEMDINQDPKVPERSYYNENMFIHDLSFTDSIIG